VTHAGILSTRERAHRTAAEIAGQHGIGPSARGVLRAALKKLRLKFRPSTQDE